MRRGYLLATGQLFDQLMPPGSDISLAGTHRAFHLPDTVRVTMVNMHHSFLKDLVRIDLTGEGLPPECEGELAIQVEPSQYELQDGRYVPIAFRAIQSGAVK